MNKKHILIVLVAVLLVIVGFWYINRSEEPELPTKTLLSQIIYACKDGKTIDASYFEGDFIPTEDGEMPIPTGEVILKLSDGREVKLPQTISASGVRYANEDESFVFWSKGNGAFILENDIDTFSGCIVLSDDVDLPNIYLGDEFSVRYPEDYKEDSSYKYEAFGPGEEINGVKFTIPEAFTFGTNLSADTGVSVEVTSSPFDCSADLFLEGFETSKEITEGDQVYSFASSTQGAVGNRYEEQVWATSTIHSCIAVRYLIHYTEISNYPEDTIEEFDRDALINEFDKIRHSLIMQ